MKRQVNFELLRIIAMFGVVMNHVFTYGLDIYDTFSMDTSSVGGFTLWSILELMKLMVLPSVNCYILLTGYFLIDRTQLRARGICRVWFTTWIIVPFLICIGTVAIVKLLPQSLMNILSWVGGISAAMFVCHPITRKVIIPISRHGDLFAGLLLYIVATIVLAMIFKKVMTLIK